MTGKIIPLGRGVTSLAIVTDMHPNNCSCGNFLVYTTQWNDTN